MQDRFRVRVWSGKKHKYLNADDVWQMTNGIVEDVWCLLAEIYQPINKEDENLIEDNKLVFEQCTGLKDKNGKLIYEGDILETTDDSHLLGNVFYDSVFGVYMMNLLENNQGIGLEQYVDLDTYTLKLKIVGNIHENPELLEEG